MVISVKRNACAFTSAGHRITNSFLSTLRVYLSTPHLINGATWANVECGINRKVEKRLVNDRLATDNEL